MTSVATHYSPNHVSSATSAPSGTSTAPPAAGDARSLSPDPMVGLTLSDDAIYEIAALLAQSAGEDRKAARAQRNAQESHLETATARRIEALKERAAEMRTAAMISGVSGMAAGACQIAGGARSLSAASTIQTQGSGPDGAFTEAQQAENQNASSMASAFAQLGGGASGMVQGVGQLGSQWIQAAAEDSMTEAARHEARAGRAQRLIDQHNDEMAEAKRLQGAVMDFLKDVRASQNAASHAAIRG